MDAALIFPCLVIGAALVSVTGFHLTLGRWLNRLVAKWLDVEVNHQEQLITEVSNHDKTAKRGFAFWVMVFGIAALLVLVIVLIVAACLIGVLYLWLPPDFFG